MRANVTGRWAVIVLKGDHASPRVPDARAWDDLSGPERARRQAILDDIRRRVDENGPRFAVASDDRARQFIPFAALTGYGDLLDETFEEADAGSCESGPPCAGDGASLIDPAC